MNPESQARSAKGRREKENPSSPTSGECREALERRIETLRAELAGVRSGVLPEIERRRDAPDAARTPALLAEALGMSVQSVNNQCARMVRAGVLTRKRHNRRCFAYRPRPESAATPAERSEARNPNAISPPPPLEGHR